MYKVATPEEISQLIRDKLSGKAQGVDIVAEAAKKNVRLKDVVGKMNLSGSDITKITPQGYGADRLGYGQNMRALGAQTKATFSGGIKGTSKNIYSALKRGMTESGGGWAGSAGTKMRYLPIGAKAGAMTSAIPELQGAFKREDATGEGRSQTERVGRAIGSVAGGLAGNLPSSVTNRMGMLGSVAGSMGATILGSKAGAAALGGVGKLVDKGVSKMRGVAAGDVTHQNYQQSIKAQKRIPGSKAV